MSPILLYQFSFIYHFNIYRCVMALIRGLKGLCPCPKCLIPQDKLSDFTQKYDLRTAESTQKSFEEAKSLGVTAKQEFLKQYGLRNVAVCVFVLFKTSSH